MAINESVVLDTIELNPAPGTASPYSLDEISFPTPRKRYEWAQGADADGAALVRDPLVDQRTITVMLRVTATTRDAINQDIAAVVAKLEEAETQPDGLPLVWTPADATKQLTFYVLSGEVGDIPITHESGYFAGSVQVPLTLTCKPFGYGAEVLNAATVTDSNPVQTLTIASVAGDVPAEARLVVTDAATQNRRHVEFGLQQRHYDASTSLLIDSAALTTTGFAGASTTRTGAYSASGVVRATLYGGLLAVCGTGNLGHVGTFRVKARVWVSAIDVRVRLSWQDGDGPFVANASASAPAAGAFAEVDLGIITVTEKTLGTQRWSGRIDAYAPQTNAATIDVDYLILIPAGELYGKARAAYSYVPGAEVSYDSFNSLGNGVVLNGRTAEVGGTWATSGATGDFLGSSATQVVSRAAITDTGRGRLAVLGSATYTDTDVSVLLNSGIVGSGMQHRVIARYVDANNFVAAYLTYSALWIERVVGGTSTVIAQTMPAGTIYAVAQWYALRLVVWASGRAIARLELGESRPGAVAFEITATDPALATGGSLAAGEVGFGDFNATADASARLYNGFIALIPPAEPIVVYAGQSLEVRHDQALRGDATGTSYGQPGAYRGGTFRLPAAGDKNRTSRVLVKARRNDVDGAADDQIADSTTVAVHYTPRYLAVPH